MSAEENIHCGGNREGGSNNTGTTGGVTVNEREKALGQLPERSRREMIPAALSQLRRQEQGALSFGNNKKGKEEESQTRDPCESPLQNRRRGGVLN